MGTTKKNETKLGTFVVRVEATESLLKARAQMNDLALKCGRKPPSNAEMVKTLLRLGSQRFVIEAPQIEEHPDLFEKS